MRLGFFLSKFGWPPTFQIRPFCTGKTVKEDMHRQLEKLDFPTAAKILFTESPTKKKFGFDFHLVQFFFACMPPLAVYLVAQYARYEMRQMEAEAEEAEKSKEMDTEMTEEISSDSDLVHLKERMDALEVAVKGIAKETQKQEEKTTKEDHAEKKPSVSSKAKSDDKLDI